MASATKNSKNIYAFDPRSLPGCLLWLDGSDSTTITLSGSSVTQWRDKSKYDYHAIASGIVSSSLPTKGTVNGLSTIYFTSNPYTALKTKPILLSDNVSNNLTYFFVIRPSISSPASKFFSSSDETRKLGLVGTVPTYLYQYSGATSASNTLPILGKNPIVCSIVENSGTMQTYVNGVANATTSATTAISVVTTLYIGSDINAGSNFDGDICEVLIYTTVLSTDQRQVVEAYLSQKWRTYIATDQTQIGITPYLQYDFSTSNTTTAFSGGTDSAATNFTYTGGDQSYTVPASCYFLKVTLTGAGGGRPYTASGPPGAGGTVVGVMPTTPGTVYSILVGGGGGISPYNNVVSPGGFGGGGQGGLGGTYNSTGGGGGGRSAIRLAGEDIVTAGGGGGACGNNQNGYSNGGNGGGTNGAGGGGSGQQGGGGSQTGGGGGSFGGTNGGKYYGGNGGGTGGGGGSGWYGGGAALASGGGGSSYIGNLVQVTTNSQGTGAAGGASDGVGGGNGTISIVSNVGGSVTAYWIDKTGNARNTSQPSTAAVPTWTTSLQNSLGGIVFTGTKFYNLPTITVSPISIFLVAKSTSYTAGATFLSLAPSSGNGIYFRSAAGASSPTYTSYNVDYGSTSYRYVTNTAITDTSTHLWSFVLPATGLGTFTFDGQLCNFANGFTTSQIATTYSLASLGCMNQSISTNPLTGVIFELIIYSSALSDTNRRGIEGFLMNKWGITFKNSLNQNSTFAITTSPSYEIVKHFSRYLYPLDLDGLTFWLDAADTTTILQTSNVITSVLNKVSGATLTLTGTLSSVAGGIAGKSVLSFAGSTYLSGTVAQSSSGSSFIVFKATAANAGYSPFFAWVDDAGTTNNPAFGYTAANTIAPYTTPSTAGTPTNSVASGTVYLVYYSWNGTATSVSINGASPTAGTQTTYVSSQSSFRIGRTSGSYLTAYIGEMLLFNTVLSYSQRLQMEGYLAKKWNITLVNIASLSVPTITRVNYSGASTTFTVPAGITSLYFQLYGAGGGSGEGGYSGGSGGYTYGYLTVTPGQVLQLRAGGAGGSGYGGYGGWNGGGLGGSYSYYGYWSGGGGGWTGVLSSDGLTLYALAGGGGGGGTYGGSGGSGGGTTGGQGGGGNCMGGTQTAAGSGDSGVQGGAWNASPNGGNGYQNAASNGYWGQSGGGGGGYWGGGAYYGLSTSYKGGGGGGSGYTGSLTSSATTQGAGSGGSTNGYIIYTYYTPTTVSHPYSLLPTSIVNNFTPRSFTNSLQLWLDSADNTTILYGTSPAVYQWLDKSGNNYHLCQPTTANQPTLSKDPVSGYSGINFVNAANTVLLPILSANRPVNSTFYSIFIVLRFSNAGISGNQTVFYTNSGTYTESAALSAGTLTASLNETSVAVSKTSATASGIWSYVAGISTFELFINGTSVGSSARSTPVLHSSAYNFGAQSASANEMSGYIHEIIILNTYGAIARQRIEGYLAQKWHITLPTTHPYYKVSPARSTNYLIPTSVATVTLTNLNYTTGTITWDSSSTNKDGYYWYIGTALGSSVISSGTVTSPTTYTVIFSVSMTTSVAYYGWVIPYNTVGAAAAVYSSATYVPNIPIAVQSVTLSGMSSTGGTITWGNAAYLGTYPATGYNWYVGTAAGSGTLTSGTINSGATLTTTFTTAITGGTNYYGWIQPFNANGNGAITYSAATATPPAVGTVTSSSMTTGGGSVAWGTSATTATGYFIYIGTTSGAYNTFSYSVTSGSTYSYTYTTTLANYVLYYVSVLPYNANGTGTITTVADSIPVAPAAVSSVSMTLTYVNPSFTATISWSTSTVATGYTVYIGTTSGASDIYSGTVSGQATASAAITSLTLTPNSSYYATIIATNTYGSSTATSSVAVTALTDLYIFSSITFTPAGYTGRNGPIKSACVSAYSATNSWVSNTAYFNMTTNGFQLWTVPSTAGYRFVVAGARGGGGGGGNYGRGGVATVDISLTKGDIIRIVVGQMGIGSNGGCGSSPYDHGGGGGGTYVYNNTTSTLLIAIGGGGGGGSSYVQNSMNAAVSSTSGNTGMSSGGAGGSGGGGGNAGSSGCTGDFGGGGGGYSSNGGSYGGNGGAAFVNGSVGGAAGSYGAEGGFGGGGGGSTYCGNGGGGYSGGGGGALSQCSCATLGAGGGGGSYFINAVSSSSSTNTGAGYVSVTKLSFGPPATVTTSLSYSAQTVTVLWDTSYSATSYTVTIYQNPTNSTIGGTSLGSATTANLTYTFTGISSLTLTQYVYATVYATTSGPINSAVTISNTVLVVAITYLNYLLTTFFANTGSIPDSSGPSGYGGNGTNWGAMIQAGQALNPILFGNNRSYLPAGYSNYSALTTGFVYSATTTTIVFRGVTDDGLIVNFNGTNVINQYQQQGATSYSSGTLTLPAGYTPIRITWYDTGGGGQYDIFITVGGGTETSDGTGYFYRTSTATY